VAIKQYVENHNENPRVFVWTASVERIRQMSPRVGQHTDEILQDLLGCTTAEVESFRASGAIR